MTKVIGLILIIGGIIYLGLTGVFEGRKNTSTPQTEYEKLTTTMAILIIIVGVYLLSNG